MMSNSKRKVLVRPMVVSSARRYIARNISVFVWPELFIVLRCLLMSGYQFRPHTAKYRVQTFNANHIHMTPPTYPPIHVPHCSPKNNALNRLEDFGGQFYKSR